MENEKKNIEIPKPPTILNRVGKDKYFEIAQMLMDEEKFKIGDEIALSALCVNYQRWLQAERAIKKNKDLCFETESGYRQQIPEISIARDCMKTMLTFIREFGLTPKERAKLKEMIINDDKNNDKEMEDMIQ
ncbi:phage terminase small subunit P27 family [Wukongibacter sp. M2B1]|uniref:phage terminase small subunit P27 family n=1 Tax=Wukongibacter sp. M2B1 TaxID=3088895 RepID=UPI003D7B9F64